MRAWLYQMTKTDQWSPKKYREEVWESTEVKRGWWAGEKIRKGDLGGIRHGDAVVFFFARGTNRATEEIGIYGWGKVTQYNPIEHRICFRPSSPSDDLKSCPAWDEDIEELIKEIRGSSCRATMFAIAPGIFKELHGHLINHGNYLRQLGRAEASVGRVVSQLGKEIRKLPKGFYGSFKFTETGNCYTHPVTLAILCKALSRLLGVRHVAMDLHLNNQAGKMQPDVVAMASIDPPQPILFVDYESPDSCDRRITWKDVAAYNKWSEGHRKRVPYLIITTLPNRKADWRLPYTARGYVNRRFRKRKDEIFRNPYRFWYGLFRKELNRKLLKRIHFANINGNRVMYDALKSRRG